MHRGIPQWGPNSEVHTDLQLTMDMPEEEDFIPEHRIRVFRKVGRDGTKIVVWDREGRVCGL